jgi:hypothetical protein
MRVSSGLAPGVVLLSLGYGRTRSGTIGDGVGFSAAVLQASASPWILRIVAVRRVGRDGRLPPSTAGLFVLDGKADELAPEMDLGGTVSPAPRRASFNPPWATPAGDP